MAGGTAVLGEETAISAARRRMPAWLLPLALSLLVLALGAVENLYGNTDDGDVYGSDAVQYLDIARAFGRHDWVSALNPLWSQGYPAILAVVRPLFAAGPRGDWTTIRTVNFAIFACNYAAFLYLVAGLWGRRRWTPLLWTGAICVFVSTQVCLGQVSRVNPDELVTALFFLACGLMLRMVQRHGRQLGGGALLGLVLGLGFLVKAVFLALGCVLLVLLAVALWRVGHGILKAAVAAAIFAAIVGSYGAALSHVVGYRTLGESGSINYAWHVNRLQKWVHWEGGTEPADKAWPKPSVANFARWRTAPPDFGTPLHPSRVVQQAPLIYSFAAPFHATYAPYFNPPYWYEGNRHIVRWRYQVIAVGKNLGDLAKVLVAQPIFLAALFVLALSLRGATARQRLREWIASCWFVVAAALLGVAIYVPVHLEGRYLAGFLAALAICCVAGAALDATGRRERFAMGVLAIGLAGELAIYQVPVWRNLAHHKSPVRNEEWKIGEAVLAEHLPEMSPVGVIAWSANLHSDWAYIAHVQITSEIQSAKDFDLFWSQTPEEQGRTLAAFRGTGAAAVFSKGKPAEAHAPGWKRMGETQMWMYRF
jgi:4-amino-4-deoxy-L-arabinose transferase-like glycosyltransferase